MIASKFSILSVDDEDIIQSLIKEVLSRDHAVSVVSSGEACLRYVENHIPDLILLDVSMPPGLNGFETCRKLKENERLHNIPIIFISGQSSEKERLKGYESGGADYIVKPFDLDGLRETVNLNLELARQNTNNSALQQRLSESNQSALHALNYSNDLNLVIQYYEHSDDFKSAKEIADKILSITTELGLRVVIQIRLNDTTEEFSDFGVITPLERQVIYENHNSGVFYQMHGHLMVNHSNITILIKNMPAQTEVSQKIAYDKLQETVRALNHAANKCVVNLATQSNSNSIIETSDQHNLVEVMILKLQNICDDYQGTTLKTLHELVDSLEQLKLESSSEETQKKLYAIIKKTKHKSTSIKNKKLDVAKIQKEIENLLEILNN